MAKKKPEYSSKKEVRAIARERVGTVKPSRALADKTKREKPKYKGLPLTDDSD